MRRGMSAAEPLSHFADECLAYLHETCPTEAAFDGVHAHDDLLEDLGREAIDTHARELGGWARRVDGIDPSGLTSEERLEQRMLGDRVRGRLFALEEIRDWERNPLYYAETLAMSLAGQVLFTYADLPERARRVSSKLRQTPRFLRAARQNVTNPPGLFTKVGIEALAGTLAFIERDLPKAFCDLDDLHLLGDLADASADAAAALRDYIGHLRDTVAPRSRASFRLGPNRFADLLRLNDGVDMPAARLLQIATRELRATQEEFKRVAMDLGSDPVEAWRQIKARHPDSSELIGVVNSQIQDLAAFVQRRRLVTIPEHKGVMVAPTPEFYRRTFASLWALGPFEPKPPLACCYITNADPSWPTERREEHLRDFNYATLWSVSMHEVYPGHLLHLEHVRKLASPLRKSALFSSTAFVEGWAHYGEQMMLDAGFERGNAEVKLGQLAEALVRLARTVVGIRLHTEDLSVERGKQFFQDEAYLEESSARREAERGTFDPTYVLYALGKQMLLKLRVDCEAAEGAPFSLQRFHDQLLSQGNIPFWMHRELMVGAGTGLLE